MNQHRAYVRCVDNAPDNPPVGDGVDPVVGALSPPTNRADALFKALFNPAHWRSFRIRRYVRLYDGLKGLNMSVQRHYRGKLCKPAEPMLLEVSQWTSQQGWSAWKEIKTGATTDLVAFANEQASRLLTNIRFRIIKVVRQIEA